MFCSYKQSLYTDPTVQKYKNALYVNFFKCASHTLTHTLTIFPTHVGRAVWGVAVIWKRRLIALITPPAILRARQVVTHLQTIRGTRSKPYYHTVEGAQDGEYRTL